jgi:hypothetical protein
MNILTRNKQKKLTEIVAKIAKGTITYVIKAIPANKMLKHIARVINNSFFIILNFI